MSDLPIADYALLADCRSAALVSRMGSVDWLCFPRFDGPSVFARLLDAQAGHWSIAVVGPVEVSRRYLEETLVLETTFRTPNGIAVLVDAMAMGRNERGHALGANSPGILLRSITCISGTVEIVFEYAPRFEYGLIFPLLRPVKGGIIARGGADILMLSSQFDLPIDGPLAHARFTLSANKRRSGRQANFALQYWASWEEAPQTCPPTSIVKYFRDTI
ncbi:MAG: trehalase-like domain-containing protein, partial [Ktedonobacteraceae bacterium]